jgi:hypothetical protein
MSKQDRINWERDGKPWQLIRPAEKLRDRLRRYGYTVYDIGNTGHLESNPPEDHTPYSETGWPKPAKYGWVYAIDIMPPTKLGLPSLQQLGAQLLKDRKASADGLRWLKYMNWEPDRDYGGPCYHEAWQPTYKRASSSDRGHIHLSGLTGYETSSIGEDYDPIARIRGGSFLMALSDQEQRELYEGVKSLRWAVGRGVPIMDDPTKMEAVTWWGDRVSKLLQEIAKRVDISPEEIAAIITQLPTLPTAEENANAILAALDGRTPEQIAVALTTVLGADVARAVGLILSAESPES